ncbi:MAG TPA: SDR family NAD(P)-dependent oxidoreductase [Candidatus Dormibacteraeota bacterium]|nr:SDR family NAD(P)-dependent oxidoreductase [Candidatus Dormibacteraeota bacterium]
MIDLKGKVALVTGGSRGLGRADCLALARAGADVVVTDILIESDPELEKTAEASQSVLSQAMASQKAVYSEKTSSEIREMGRRSVALKMDVTNREQVKTVVDQVVKEFGSLDILVNNAGTLDHMGTVDNQVDALWDRDLKVNLTGAFNVSKAVWPHMKQRNWGRIIMMSSIAGALGGFGQASYSTTKAGLVGLARTLALEGARYAITVNAIVPGIIATEAFKMGRPDMNERMIKRVALRRPGEPEDIANAIAFLCSPVAGYITGVALPVTGGLDLFTF